MLDVQVIDDRALITGAVGVVIQPWRLPLCQVSRFHHVRAGILGPDAPAPRRVALPRGT